MTNEQMTRCNLRDTFSDGRLVVCFEWLLFSTKRLLQFYDPVYFRLNRIQRVINADPRHEFILVWVDSHAATAGQILLGKRGRYLKLENAWNCRPEIDLRFVNTPQSEWSMDHNPIGSVLCLWGDRIILMMMRRINNIKRFFCDGRRWTFDQTFHRGRHREIFI